jgi:N-acetylneuraminate synthase
MIKLIGEIGINHNGSLELAKRLIELAAISGFNFVKFQKRTPELCVPENQKRKLRQTPWGEMTYLEYKFKLEFDFDQYAELSNFCALHGIGMFASVWDMKSAEFMKEFSQIVKIPSALITDIELIKYCRENYETLIISTGMSTEEEIETAVKEGNPDIIFHSVASYPTKIDELNLQYITWLKDKYTDKSIGYSGHDDSIGTTYAAASLGAEWIERHITLDRGMWGSDQSFSVGPVGMFKLVEGVRNIEKAMTGYGERVVLKSEIDKKISLRG